MSGKKRAKNLDGCSKIPFETSWAICAQDLVFGSPQLALDWCKCSVTPPNLIHVTTGERFWSRRCMELMLCIRWTSLILVSILLSCTIVAYYALLFLANAHFIASSTQIRAMKNENIALEKVKNKHEKEFKKWESRALVAEDPSYQEKYSSLTKKKQLEFHKLLEVYH